MNIYIDPKTDSRGILRVYSGLKDHAPDDVSFVTDENEADIVVLHVIGRRDHIARRAKKIKASGREYVIIQYCLRSTMRPSTYDWIDIWNDAKFVMSYFDLPALCTDDGMSSRDVRFRFYHTALGVEAGIFYPMTDSKRYVVATCGNHALSQGVKEAAVASKIVEKTMFHLGHDLRRGTHITEFEGINDLTLAWFYSQCQYVVALRRTEGFECPAAEGLLCGARPILFDRKHYRDWYDGLAIFMPEGSREEVTKHLVDIFRYTPDPVTESDIEQARTRFNWVTIAKGFWERIV